MSGGARRSLIPEVYRNLEEWPAPDEQALEASVLSVYRRRKKAVELYSDGRSFASIREEAGLSKEEVRRLVKRCITAGHYGQMLGFYGLIPGWRVACYKREAEVSHVVGAGSGGCAGALGQLFARFPEVEEFVRERYMPAHKGSMAERQIRYVDLHADFKKKLLDLGLTDLDWPFNTGDQGKKSLRLFCKQLINEQPGRWLGARAGDEAVRRSGVGSGHRPVFPMLRGYGACQLDFHKVDAASIIVFENEAGERMRVPVARWHIGLIAEERWGLVLGACIALERTPSGDSVLETVESALRPPRASDLGVPCPLTADGKIFPNELLPDLAYQGFAVLKMDNAWSNAGTQVVNNIIETVGCAVNFGPVRAWWRRPLIERIFGELTRKGLQRLPSTLGAGPGDTRRNHPNEQAIKFEITITDLVAVVYGSIRRHNETRTEGAQFSSPLGAIENALARRHSGVFRQPIPLSDQLDLKLLSRIEIVTVRGNLKKHVRPYVKLGRWVYTSQTLANAYDLIGRQLVLYCDRRDVQVVYATVKETGEQLGPLHGPRKWKDLHISWRDRAILSREGLRLRTSENGTTVVSEWCAQKGDSIAKDRKKAGSKNRSSKDALLVAKIITGQQKLREKTEAPVPEEVAVELQVNPSVGQAYFGLDERLTDPPMEFGD